MDRHGLLRGSFTSLYTDDVRTSLETYAWTVSACYGVALLLYMQMMFVPQRKQTPPWAVPRTAFVFLAEISFAEKGSCCCVVGTPVSPPGGTGCDLDPTTDYLN
jgi:hypothetical protein